MQWKLFGYIETIYKKIFYSFYFHKIKRKTILSVEKIKENFQKGKCIDIKYF